MRDFIKKKLWKSKIYFVIIFFKLNYFLKIETAIYNVLYLHINIAICWMPLIKIYYFTYQEFHDDFFGRLLWSENCRMLGCGQMTQLMQNEHPDEVYILKFWRRFMQNTLNLTFKKKIKYLPFFLRIIYLIFYTRLVQYKYTYICRFVDYWMKKTGLRFFFKCYCAPDRKVELVFTIFFSLLLLDFKIDGYFRCYSINDFKYQLV